MHRNVLPAFQPTCWPLPSSWKKPLEVVPESAFPSYKADLANLNPLLSLFPSELFWFLRKDRPYHLRHIPHIGDDQPLAGPGGGHVELAGIDPGMGLLRVQGQRLMPVQ